MQVSVPELRDQDSYLEGSNSLFQESRNKGNKSCSRLIWVMFIMWVGLTFSKPPKGSECSIHIMQITILIVMQHLQAQSILLIQANLPMKMRI